MNLKLDISFFIRHCYYLNRVNIKNQKSKRFRCNNSACEHTAIATKIGFDNQLPSRIARLNAKGETSNAKPCLVCASHVRELSQESLIKIKHMEEDFKGVVAQRNSMALLVSC